MDESPSVILAADTASERAALPKASSFGGCLLLADRGYFDRDYLLELTKAGASFVIRAQKGLNPKCASCVPGGFAMRLERFATELSYPLALRIKGLLNGIDHAAQFGLEPIFVNP